MGEGFPTLVAAVVGFLDDLGVDRVHLVGHSLGGAVVAAIAGAAPDRVASLTLIAPVGFGSEINAAYLRGFAAAGDRRSMKAVLGDLFAADGAVTRQMVDDLLRYKRLDGVQGSLDALLDGLLAGDGQALDVRDRARAFPGPAAVVWGAADKVIPPTQAGAAAATLAGVDEATVIDGAGHMPQIESAPRVVEAVQATITRAKH